MVGFEWLWYLKASAFLQLFFPVVRFALVSSPKLFFRQNNFLLKNSKFGLKSSNFGFSHNLTHDPYICVIHAENILKISWTTIKCNTDHQLVNLVHALKLLIWCQIDHTLTHFSLKNSLMMVGFEWSRCLKTSAFSQLFISVVGIALISLPKLVLGQNSFFFFKSKFWPKSSNFGFSHNLSWDPYICVINSENIFGISQPTRK